MKYKITLQTTTYTPSVVYKNDQAAFIATPEGYIDMQHNPPVYVYQYRDHLGNNRLSYADTNDNGSIDTPYNSGVTVWEDGFEDKSTENGDWESEGAKYGRDITGFDTSFSHTGIKSGYINLDTQDSGWIDYYVHSNEWIAVDNSEPTLYRFSGWVYLESSLYRGQFFFFMNTEDETNYATDFAYVETTQKNQWVYMEKVAMVHPEIEKINFRIDADGWGEHGGTAWFDDLKIERLGSHNEIVSETNYYPFGLVHKGYNEQKTSDNLGENYKYANKELEEDLEVNTIAYGWRDYDPAIARFNKIDRFAEKYNSITPYHFAANNPMYYVDMQGDSLWIQHKNNKILYQNGNLYNKDGSAYTGKGVKVQKDGSVKLSGFLKKTVNALGEIGKGEEGSAMISELQSSDNNFTIVKGTSSRHVSVNSFKAHAKQWATDPKQAATYKMLLANSKDFSGGSGGTIYWNSSGTPLITTMGVRTDATTDLAHEMFHGLDANRGALDDRLYNGVQRSEWQATYRENMLRTQLGLPVRTHYKSQLNVSTGKRTGVAPRMLNSAPANSPMLPSWYKK